MKQFLAQEATIHVLHLLIQLLECFSYFYVSLAQLSNCMEGRGGLSLFSFPGHRLFLSRGETDNGPRRLTSAGRGRTDRRQQLEGQTIEWKRVVKDGERKWSRSSAEAEYEPWSASKSRSCRGDETLSVFVCADTKEQTKGREGM